MLRAYINKQITERKEKERKEFAAKLKYGKDWHWKLYPHKYSSGTGPR